MIRNNATMVRQCFFLFTIVLCAALLPLAAFSETGGLEMGVKINSEFKISLESNPTTGYKWETKLDENFLKLTSDIFNRPSDARIGQSGTQTFVFLPIKAGETVIEFIYKRSWEKESAKNRRYKITIKP